MKLRAKLPRQHILEHSQNHDRAGAACIAARAQPARSRPPSNRLDGGHRARAQPSAWAAEGGLNLDVVLVVNLDVDLLHDEEHHYTDDRAQRDGGDESSRQVRAASHLDQPSSSTTSVGKRTDIFDREAFLVKAGRPEFK